MSIFLAAAVSLYSGLRLGLAVVLFLLSFAGATASFFVEWVMIGRAFVEVYPDGSGTVRNRYKQWSGWLDPRVTVGPLSATWSWNGVWVGVTDEPRRATKMLGAVAIDPNTEGPALAEILLSTRPG